MKIELIWLAYDHTEVNRSWQDLTVGELYLYILKDEYRRKVDPRTMLFHKNQYFLLNTLEGLMKRGVIDITLLEYMAYLYRRGIEELPVILDEYFFDFQIISFFSSLKMADDYQFAEDLITVAFRKIGILPQSKKWTYLYLSDIEEFFKHILNITDTHLYDIFSIYKKGDALISFDQIQRFVRNYIEFYHYAKNNNLQIFVYNNYTDTKFWGDLISRKNKRVSRIVSLALSPLVIDNKKEKLFDAKKRDIKLSLREKHSIDAIINALLYDYDPLIKQKAAETLGLIGDTRVVPYLIEVLKDDESDVKSEAAKALGELGDHYAIDPLIEALYDNSISVITNAAFSLFLIGDKKALGSLVSTLLRGIIQVTVPIFFYPKIAKSDYVKDAMLENIDKANVVIRRQIAFILGRFKNKKSISALKRALSDNDEEVRLNSLASLLKIGTKYALYAAKEVLHFVSKSESIFIPPKIEDKLKTL